ncbi:MAG: LamG domain-containing protein [Bryobacteraceae bacterium]
MKPPKSPQNAGCGDQPRSGATGEDDLIRYWEGIAEALQVSVKTAQRYEKQYGLPVRRKRGPRGTVIYALRSEIEAWLISKPDPTPEDREPAGPQAARRVHPWHWILAASAALVAIAAIWYWKATTYPPGLAGWWRFDEPGGNRILDSSGNGNNGIIFRKLQRVSGEHGGALLFEGDGYASAAFPGRQFPAGDSPYTVSAWVKCSQLPRNPVAFFHFGIPTWSTPRSNALLRIAQNGVLVFEIGFGYEAIEGHTNLVDNRWHHVVASYQGSDTRRVATYADGEAEGRGILNGPAHLPKAPQWTVGVNLGGSFPFTGLLSDVRLYRGALTHPEIAALYRCALPEPDIRLPGKVPGYYLPLYRATITQEHPAENQSSTAFRYDGFGRGGIEFAAADRLCALDQLRGASIAEDLQVAVDLKLPSDTEGGPFLRAARVRPGDAIEAPRNSGYWVRLHADGTVSVHSLGQRETAPNRPIVQTGPVPGFVPGGFHNIKTEAHGTHLRVWVDGAAVHFGPLTTLDLPAGGLDEHAAGIAFFVQGQPVESIEARNAAVSSLARD